MHDIEPNDPLKSTVLNRSESKARTHDFWVKQALYHYTFAVVQRLPGISTTSLGYFSKVSVTNFCLQKLPKYSATFGQFKNFPF